MMIEREYLFQDDNSKDAVAEMSQEMEIARISLPLALPFSGIAIFLWPMDDLCPPLIPSHLLMPSIIPCLFLLSFNRSSALEAVTVDDTIEHLQCLRRSRLRHLVAATLDGHEGEGAGPTALLGDVVHRGVPCDLVCVARGGCVRPVVPRVLHRVAHALGPHHCVSVRHACIGREWRMANGEWGGWTGEWAGEEMVYLLSVSRRTGGNGGRNII